MNNFMRNVKKTVLAFTMIMVTLSLSTSCFAVPKSYSYLIIARNCKLYLANNGFRYCKGGAKEFPVDVDNTKRIDCSGFVSWTVYEYQEGNFEYKTSKWFLSTAKKLYNNEETDSPELTKDWTAVKGYENFLPGDILCYPGHVHIYYGIDPMEKDHYLVLNAGSSSALKKGISSIGDSYFRRAQYAIRIY